MCVLGKKNWKKITEQHGRKGQITKSRGWGRLFAWLFTTNTHSAHVRRTLVRTYNIYADCAIVSMLILVGIRIYVRRLLATCIRLVFFAGRAFSLFIFFSFALCMCLALCTMHIYASYIGIWIFDIFLFAIPLAILPSKITHAKTKNVEKIFHLIKFIYSPSNWWDAWRFTAIYSLDAAIIMLCVND